MTELDAHFHWDAVNTTLAVHLTVPKDAGKDQKVRRHWRAAVMSVSGIATAALIAAGHLL